MGNTKAMIIIDMPKQCYGCDFCQFDGTPNGRVCTRTGVYVQKDGFNITKSRHETCPLKPLPTKKLAAFDPNHCDIDEEIKIIHEIEGYNRCIDEILEGDEV